MGNIKRFFMNTPRELDTKSPSHSHLNCAVILMWSKSETFRNYVIAHIEDEKWCFLLGTVFRKSRSYEPVDLLPFVREIGWREPPQNFFQCLFSLIVLIEDQELRRRAERSFRPEVERVLRCVDCDFTNRTCDRLRVLTVYGRVNVGEIIDKYESKRRQRGVCPANRSHTVLKKAALHCDQSKSFLVDTRNAILRGPLTTITKGRSTYAPTVIICKDGVDMKYYQSPQAEPAFSRVQPSFTDEQPVLDQIELIYFEKVEDDDIGSETPPPSAEEPVNIIPSDISSDEEVPIPNGLRDQVLQSIDTHPGLVGSDPGNPDHNTRRERAFAEITEWLWTQGHNVNDTAVSNLSKTHKKKL